jgi:hypothetical protein
LSGFGANQEPDQRSNFTKAENEDSRKLEIIMHPPQIESNGAGKSNPAALKAKAAAPGGGLITRALDGGDK